LGSLRPEPLPHLISDRARWSSLGAAELSAYLEGGAYGGWVSPPQAPLATSTLTGAGEERVLLVTLRPVRWDPRSGSAIAVESITLDVSWDAAPATRRAPRAGRRALAYSGPRRLEPDRPWVRLGILRPGLYAVSAADLAQAGVSTGSIDPASFRLFRGTPGDLPESVSVDLAPDSLRECAIVVTGEGDGAFDPGDRVYFYATGQTGFGYDLERGGSVNYREAQRSDEE